MSASKTVTGSSSSNSLHSASPSPSPSPSSSPSPSPSPSPSTSTSSQLSSSASSPLPIDVVAEFQLWIREQPNIAVAVAAMQALLAVVRHSTSTTMMGLEIELKAAIDQLLSCHSSSISLSAGCELFSRYVTRTSLDTPQFTECVKKLLQRGEVFAAMSSKSRSHISTLADRFISNGKCILIHGYSRVVHSVLVHSATVQKKQFRVIVTEGRPSCDGYHAAQQLLAIGIPTTLILDSAVAYTLSRVDLVLMGAEGVAESGGIINKCGSYQIALLAHALHKPMYVAAECYKFTRLFPLSQRDLPEAKSSVGREKRVETIERELGVKIHKELVMENVTIDYTPPEYITLLFTDLGILTPSAVSDELIKLYN